ncbi:MAG: hypothetical protein WB795_17510 [Candidatus Acidiferrales bacterium]
MRIRGLLMLTAVLLLAGIAVTAARAADDPIAGTWKINIAKSKYSPGPAPQSGTVTIKVENDTETYDADTVDASGNTSHASFSAKFDGTDAPETGNPDADTISLKRVSKTHVVATIKKGGAVVQTANVVVAADGKSRTVTFTGKNAKGEKVHNIVVYDKQ